MSATLDDKLLSKYYNGACVIEVPGRPYPIEDIYAMEDAENHVDEAINKVLEIHASRLPGDILVFLAGQDEIDRAIDEVTRKIDPIGSAIILPLHGKLSEDEIKAAFMPMTSNTQRKIIFATNIAETSVTIDGIRYVIDSGMVKEVMWDSKRHLRILKTGYTTQSSIKQRRGRTGRTSAGKVNFNRVVGIKINNLFFSVIIFTHMILTNHWTFVLAQKFFAFNRASLYSN
jgi:HrpA-like RNA helicase